MSMTAIWIVALIFFLVFEAAVPGLVSIWFAAGALCALVAALLGAPIWLQIAWFFIVSIAALIVTRPFAKKYFDGKAQPTNADRVVGMDCVVIEAIDNLAGTGAVICDGKTWTARSAGGETIDKDAVVTVSEIVGVKLIVSLKKQNLNIEY